MKHWQTCHTIKGHQFCSHVKYNHRFITIGVFITDKTAIKSSHFTMAISMLFKQVVNFIWSRGSPWNEPTIYWRVLWSFWSLESTNANVSECEWIWQHNFVHDHGHDILQLEPIFASCNIYLNKVMESSPAQYVCNDDLLNILISKYLKDRVSEACFC